MKKGISTFSCSFIFFGDDEVQALEERIIAALTEEDLDFDPLTVEVTLESKPEEEA